MGGLVIGRIPCLPAGRGRLSEYSAKEQNANLKARKADSRLLSVACSRTASSVGRYYLAFFFFLAAMVRFLGVVD